MLPCNKTSWEVKLYPWTHQIVDQVWITPVPSVFRMFRLTESGGVWGPRSGFQLRPGLPALLCLQSLAQSCSPASTVSGEVTFSTSTISASLPLGLCFCPSWSPPQPTV